MRKQNTLILDKARPPQRARSSKAGIAPDSWDDLLLPDLEPAGEHQDFSHRLMHLACAVLRAQHGALGFASVENQWVQLAWASCPSANAGTDGPLSHALIETLLQQALSGQGCVRLQHLAEALPGKAFQHLGPFLGVKFYSQGRCGGALYFVRSTGEPAFTAQDEALARAFGTLLEQHDFTEKAQLLVRLRLLVQVAQAASVGTDMPKTLRLALRELERHLPMSFCAVWLLGDDDDLILSCRSEPLTDDWDTDQIQPGTRWSLKASPFAECVKSRKPLYLDRLKESDSRQLREWGEWGATTCLVVPLLSGQTPVGVLQSLCTRPAGLTQNQLQLVYSVADLLGPVVSNHQLYDRLSKAYRQLQSAQQQLVNSEKMRALGELAGGMAHDFNNALCGTLGYIELALKDQTLGDSSRGYLNMAKTCTLDAASTVRRVQDFARWERGIRDAQLVDPNKLVKETADLTRHKWQDLSHSRSHFVELELLSEAQAHVLGNPSELREVLTNLIFNAVDAMPAGGKLTLRTTDDKGAVLIAVRDNGTGMTRDVQQRLFEPFFSTKGERGTGLGLSVSYAIVHRHGGQLSFVSEPGQGTTFMIQLPAAERPTQSPPPSLDAMSLRLNVLVVDDDLRALHFIKESLAVLGHEPETATGGLEALELFERKDFDLLITDLGMPVMSGEELARRVRSLAPEVPIILLTGWADQLKAQPEPMQAVDLVLGKPVTIDQLTAAIGQVCQNHIVK